MGIYIDELIEIMKNEGFEWDTIHIDKFADDSYKIYAKSTIDGPFMYAIYITSEGRAETDGY